MLGSSCQRAKVIEPHRELFPGAIFSLIVDTTDLFFPNIAIYFERYFVVFPISVEKEIPMKISFWGRERYTASVRKKGKNNGRIEVRDDSLLQITK